MEQYIHKYEQEEVDDDLPHLTNLLMQLSEKNYKCIKDQKKLQQSLIKLYNMIGMKSIKESIAKQTSYLISKLEQGNFSMKMLNTVLCGNPGSGKTTMGVIMAEIWCHLGFLQNAVSLKDSKKNYLSKLSSINTEMLQFYLLIAVLVFSKLYEVVQPLYHKYGITLLLILGLLIITLLYNLFNYTETQIKSEENIIITSRSNFIGNYVGWTAPKTEALLNDNRGKVIFIDEAYSLYNGYGDTFGMEALTALNKYMSEHEDEIVVIFAGYEDLMKETIFKVQPGLNRRCMWQFNCIAYEPEELYQIYIQQLKKDKLEIYKQDYYKIQEYIVDHADLFVNQGGDCEKLSFFSQLSKSSRGDSSPYISYIDVKNGIKELKQNNINKIPTKPNMMEELMKKFN